MMLRERAAHLRLAIEVISDKWRIAVLDALSAGPLRTSQLQRRLEEVAPKMLTQTLRGLERDGLIERVAYTASALRVEYRLTDIARHLLTALDELCRWSQAHGRHTLVARSRYDAQKCATPITSRRAAVAIVGFGSQD